MKRLCTFMLGMILSFQVFAGEQTVKILAVHLQAKTPIKKYISAEDMRGVVLAVEDINMAGGILGKQLEAIDGTTHSAVEASLVSKMALQDKNLIAVVGANVSNVTLRLAPMFQENQIPIISPISTNPKVTAVGDYVFRACFTDPFQGKVMARYALDDLSAKTAVILKKVTSQFSIGLSKHFKDTFEKEGRILWEGSYLVEDVDFTDLLTRVKNSNPDVVFLPGHGRDSGLILKQAKSMGIRATFLGGDGWGKGTLGIGGAEAVEGHAFSNHWHMNVDSPKSRDFVAKYLKKFGGSLIAASAALAYDSTMLIAEAAKLANSLDPKKIRNALLQIKNYSGVTGTFNFDEQGDPINKDGVILKYMNGEIVYVKTIKP